MNCSNRLFAVVSVFLAVPVLFGIGTIYARDAEPATVTLAAAQAAKQQCMNTCRARCRDCRRLNQLPSFECRGVYRDAPDTLVLA
jgi:hypothetical protein